MIHATRFAPILRFGEGERFFPADFITYSKFTDVCQVELYGKGTFPFKTYDQPHFSHCVDTQTGELAHA